VKLLQIAWRDAHHEFSQDGEDRPRADYIVQTVGWLISRDELFISLAAERLPEDDGWRAVTHIPISCIVTGCELIAAASETQPG
jgi:hypothetical protein